MKITYLITIFVWSFLMARADDPNTLPLTQVAVWIDCHEAPPQTTAYFDFTVASAYGVGSNGYIVSNLVASVKKAALVNTQTALPAPYVYVHQAMVVNLNINLNKSITLQDFQGVASFKDFSHPGPTKRCSWSCAVQGTSALTKIPKIQADFVVQFIFGTGANRLVEYLHYPVGNAVGKTYPLQGSGSGSYLSFNADDFSSNPGGYPVNGSTPNSSYYSPSNPPDQGPDYGKKTGAPLHKTTLPLHETDTNQGQHTGT